MNLRSEFTGVAESPMVQIATAAERMPGSLKLCYGESDIPTPAFICDAAAEALRAGHTFYTHTAGCTELRQAIADKVLELHRARYTPAEIMATTGATLAIYAAIRAFVGRGANAVIVSPAYAIFVNSVILAGGEPRPVPLVFSGNRYHLDLDRLRAAIDGRTRMLIVNSPANPTGWVITEHEQRAILELAERHDLVVLADEVYERLIYDGQTVAPSFARQEVARRRLIVVNSFSKTYNMTGWRLGWAQGDEQTIKAMYRAVEFITSNPAAMVQQAGIAALRFGEPHIASLREQYAGRRMDVLDSLRAVPGIALPDPEGAFYVYPKFGDASDSRAFTSALLEHTGVALAPGIAFGQDGEGHVRICFAASRPTIVAALARLSSYIRR